MTIQLVFSVPEYVDNEQGHYGADIYLDVEVTEDRYDGIKRKDWNVETDAYLIPFGKDGQELDHIQEFEDWDIYISDKMIEEGVLNELL